MKVVRRAILFGLALFAVGGYASAATGSRNEKSIEGSSIATSMKGDTQHASDQDIRKRVRAALDSAPYLYAEHITVTSKNGVVTLNGLVGSEWDLRDAIKVSSRVDGVRRVDDDLEIWDFGGSRR
jgi:osmotically-inducible protein OsmY